MIFKPAHDWLAEADFDLHDDDLKAGLVQLAGYDKADEIQAALQRITENLLDALGATLISEDSLLKLQRAVASIAIDNYLPKGQHG